MDFNVNFTNASTHQENSSHIDGIFSHGWIPFINRPTRVAINSASLIDHAITNKISIKIHVLSRYYGHRHIDHYSVFIYVNHLSKQSQQSMKYKVARKMTPGNCEKFKTVVSSYDWSTTLTNPHWIKWPPFLRRYIADAFSWIKSVVFWLKFHYSLFINVQLTITQHWFK